MDNKNKIKEYLISQKICFKELEHEDVGDPIEYSEKIGTRLEQQAKALLLRCKIIGGGKYFIIVTLPANKKADFEKIMRKIKDIKSIRIAEKEQLLELTGCKFGELPPLGKLWGLKLFMDSDLLKEPQIYFNAGSLKHSIIANPNDIALIEEAIFI